MSELAQQILAQAESILIPLVPDSKIDGVELIGRNPRRDDKTAGSFKINLDSGM